MTTPTRSLRASIHPQARMQEMLRQANPPSPEVEPAPEVDSEAASIQIEANQGEVDQPARGNNEGNFITSQLPIKEEVNQVIEEDSFETPKKTTKKTMNKSSSITSDRTSDRTSSKPSDKTSKLSLKDTVLEDTEGQEEKARKTRLNVDIEEDLHFWLKGHAIQNRRKLNDLIPRILKAYRDEVEGE